MSSQKRSAQNPKEVFDSIISESNGPRTDALMSRALDHVIATYGLDTLDDQSDIMSEEQHQKADTNFRSLLNASGTVGQSLGLMWTYSAFVKSCNEVDGFSGPVLRDIGIEEYEMIFRRYRLLGDLLQLYAFQTGGSVSLKGLRRICMWSGASALYSNPC